MSLLENAKLCQSCSENYVGSMCPKCTPKAVLSGRKSQGENRAASVTPGGSGGKIQNENRTHCPIPHAKPKRHKTPALGRAIQGKVESDGRAVVRFVGYRVRPLDPDNFAGSVKDLLDGCRHAGLIPGDESWRIILETEQVCVRSYSQEKTVIEIDAL